jgi:hypothetical protein
LACSLEHLLDITVVVLRLSAATCAQSFNIHPLLRDGSLINDPALARLMELSQSLTVFSQLRPSVLAIQKARPFVYRAKVLGRALSLFRPMQVAFGCFYQGILTLPFRR